MSKTDTDLLMCTIEDLDLLALKRAQTIMFRSKARWYNEGEQNTKYFFGLERARYNARTCLSLITDGGVCLKTQRF